MENQSFPYPTSAADNVSLQLSASSTFKEI